MWTIRPELFVALIYCLVYLPFYCINDGYLRILKTEADSTCYGNHTTFPSFCWQANSITYLRNLNTVVQCVSQLITGICATLFFPLTYLLILSGLLYGVGFTLWEIALFRQSPCFTPENVTFFTENSAKIVIPSLVFLSIAYGSFRVLLFVLLLDQVEPKKIHYVLCLYMAVINISVIGQRVLLVLWPTLYISKYQLVLFVPILVSAAMLLVGGYKKKYYTVRNEFVNIFTRIQNHRNNISQSVLFRNSNGYLLSFMPCILVFWILLPFGIVDSQVRYLLLSDLEVKQMFYSFSRQVNYTSNIFFRSLTNLSPTAVTDIFNCGSVILIMTLVIILRHVWPMFKKHYNILDLRLVVGKTFLCLGTITSTIFEYERVTNYLKNSNNLCSDQFRGLKYSVFLMLPQTFLISVGEFCITVSGYQFMHYNVSPHLRPLAMSLLLSVAGVGGAGSIINILIDAIAIGRLYDSDNINIISDTGAHHCYPGQLYTLFCYVSVLAFLSLLLTLLILRSVRLKHPYMFLIKPTATAITATAITNDHTKSRTRSIFSFLYPSSRSRSQFFS